MSSPSDDNSKRPPQLKDLPVVSVSSRVEDEEQSDAATYTMPSQMPRGKERAYFTHRLSQDVAKKIVNRMHFKPSNVSDPLTGLTTSISLDSYSDDSIDKEDEGSPPKPPSGWLPNGQNNIAVLKHSFKEVEQNAKVKSDSKYIVKFRLGVLAPGDDLAMLVGKVVSWTNPNASVGSNEQLVSQWKQKLVHHHKQFESNYKKFIEKFGLRNSIQNVEDMDRVKQLFQIKAEVEMEVLERLHKTKLGLGPGNPVKTKINYIEEVQRIKSQAKPRGKPKNASSP